MKRFLLAALFLITAFMGTAGHSEVLDKMKTSDGKIRYWAWFYNFCGGPGAHDKFLAMCRELKSWGCTDIIWESLKGVVPWPTDLELTFTGTAYAPPGDFEYNRKYDRTDALCRAAKKYGMKIWFSKVPRESSGIESLGRYGWEKSDGYKFGKAMMEKRRKAGFYATDAKGRIIKHGEEDWKRYYDLNGKVYLQHLKDQLTEVKKKYGHYGVIAGFVLDEFELTLVADPLSDDIEDFSAFCEKNFGEKYPGKEMPQNSGSKPDNKWWRREMLYRFHILNTFFREIAAHAHKLGFEIIKPNRNLEDYDNWTWKCGMNFKDYSRDCDYIWISTNDKSQLDPYLNTPNIMVGMGMAYGRIAERFSKCFHGVPLSDHAYPCGTTTSLPFYTDAEKKLFFGHQNNRDWFTLFNRWTGGKSPAKVAIAVNSPVFTMQYPETKTMYDKFAAPLFEELSRSIDVDGFQLFQTRCLEKYPVIIVPHAMPVAMTDKEFAAYLEFVKKGGTLITINARWSTGSKDLTGLKDVTSRITGLKLKKTPGSFKGRIESKCNWLKSPGTVFDETPFLQVEGASENVKVLAADAKGDPLICGYPLGKGKVYSILFPLTSLVSGGKKELLEIPEEIIKKSVHLPVISEGNIQIVQTVLKDHILAVSMQFAGEKVDPAIVSALKKLNINSMQAAKLGVVMKGPGKKACLLKIDAGALGIKGEKLPGKYLDTGGRPLFSVVDIITGRVIESPYRNKGGRDLNRYAASWTAEELLKGVPLQLKFENEFKVIAVSAYERLRDFHGVMPGQQWIDAGTAARKGMDTPTTDELGLKAKGADAKGVKVGIYLPVPEISTRAYGVKETFAAVKSMPGFTPVIINDIRPEVLKKKKIKILIYCQSAFKKDRWIRNLLNKRTAQLRKWVLSGGSLLARHDVPGYRSYPVIFPDICKGGSWHTWGVTGKDAPVCVIKNPGQVLKSFRKGDTFEHSYEDHVQLEKGPEGKVLAVDKIHGKPVIIAGKSGKGKYIADGTAGYSPKNNKLTEKEIKILHDYLEWLAE